VERLSRTWNIRISPLPARRARERVPLADFRLFVIVSRPDDLQLRHDDEEAFRQKAKAAEGSSGEPPARFSPLLLSLVKPDSPRGSGDHASHKPRAATPSDPLFRSLVTLPDLPAAHVHHQRAPPLVSGR